MAAADVGNEALRFPAGLRRFSGHVIMQQTPVPASTLRRARPLRRPRDRDRVRSHGQRRDRRGRPGIQRRRLGRVGRSHAKRGRSAGGSSEAAGMRASSAGGSRGSLALGADGRNTRNDAPPPSRSCTHARPPCSSANRRTRVSPTPTPGECCGASGPWRNGSNSVSRRVVGHAGPVVLDHDHDPRRVRFDAHPDRRAARSVPIGVGEQVLHDALDLGDVDRLHDRSRDR